jgi:hypothetical protein
MILRICQRFKIFERICVMIFQHFEKCVKNFYLFCNVLNVVLIELCDMLSILFSFYFFNMYVLFLKMVGFSYHCCVRDNFTLIIWVLWFMVKD